MKLVNAVTKAVATDTAPRMRRFLRLRCSADPRIFFAASTPMRGDELFREIMHSAWTAYVGLHRPPNSAHRGIERSEGPSRSPYRTLGCPASPLWPPRYVAARGLHLPSLTNVGQGGVDAGVERTLGAHRLAAARKERGWSQEALALRIRKEAAIGGLHLSTTKKTVARWEHGVVPDLSTQKVIAKLFGVSVAECGARAWPTWLPTGLIIGAQLRWSAVDTNVALEEAAGRAFVDRRNFLVLTGAALTQPAYEWLLARIEPIVGNGAAREVTNETILRLNRVTDDLRRLDEERGSGSVQPVVLQHLKFVTGLLRNAKYSERAGRALYSAAAEVAQLAGWLAYDTERHAAAQQLWTTALHAAHMSGDRVIGASILNFMSYQASTLGNFREAVAMAELPLSRRIGSIPARVQALLLSRRALGESCSTNSSQPGKSLNLATAAMDRASNAPQPEWSHWFKEAELYGVAGRCFLQAGDFAQASKHLRVAIDVQTSDFVRGKALYTAQLAMSELCMNELDAALEVGHQAVDLSEQISSRRIIEQLSLFDRRLASTPAGDGVADLRERIRILQDSQA